MAAMFAPGVGNPLLKPLSIFLVALTLSIGWGIRGDFGHEAGAWIPGALSAMAICLLSGREDWWRRGCYCALFSGLGWGFGGSISYMTTLSYASSGLLPTIWYGYSAVFLVGGLWAGMGAAGMTLPLSIERDRLTRLFTPLCFVLVSMYVGQVLEEPITRVLTLQSTAGMKRHESPLYWFDSDWYETTFALIGVCIYDLWDRRFSKCGHFVLFATLGALLGFLIQEALKVSGLISAVTAALVVPQGDLTAINPETNAPYDPNLLIVNWPRFMIEFHQLLGLGIGFILGLIIYFHIYGKWRNDAGLFLHMAVGWWLAFLLMPVLLSVPLYKFGGFRLTPPRGDNWAGVLGVFIAVCRYAMRNGMAPVAIAASRNFILGGIAFPTVHIIRSMILIPGHPDINWRTGIPPAWKHFQSANWHSIMEQSQGFAFGIATTITMASLWRRLKPVTDDPPVRRWTDIIAITFVVFGMSWFNVFKNVEEWTQKGLKLVPGTMTAPFFEQIKLSAEIWFGIAWWAIALAFVLLMFAHVQRGLIIVPVSWGGRVQLVYVLLLWIMVIANLQRSMAGQFHEQRLITEWLIIVNSALATFLVIAVPKPCGQVPFIELREYGRSLIVTWVGGLCVAGILMSLYAILNHSVYGQAKINMPNIRWGPKADWRVRPLLKNKPHR
jgi:hypothetical protein